MVYHFNQAGERMYRFFIDSEQLNNDLISITGDDYNHIKNVLRMKIGEKVLLSDGSDKEYEACIIRYNDHNAYALNGYDSGESNATVVSKNKRHRDKHDIKDEVILKITDVFGSSRELPSKITLFQGYPKGDKMEQIVQKAVELGACEIVPVMMNRCVVKLDEKKAVKKAIRLNSIAEGAAKQSKRGIIPKVRDVMSMEQALEYAKSLEYVIIPYESAEGMEYSRRILKDAAEKGSVGVFIGPEGGFENFEVEKLKSIGGRIITLGHRILRTETAGMTVLSILMWLMED